MWHASDSQAVTLVTQYKSWLHILAPAKTLSIRVDGEKVWGDVPPERLLQFIRSEVYGARRIRS